MLFLQGKLLLKMKKRKGYLLIEVLMAISIAGILLSTIFFALNNEKALYKKESLKLREKVQVEEAFRYIKDNIAHEVKRIEVLGVDGIRLFQPVKGVVDEKKDIYSQLALNATNIKKLMISGTNLVERYENGDNTTNVILRGVKEVKFKMVNGNLKLSLKMESNNCYEEIFIIRFIEKKEV